MPQLALDLYFPLYVVDTREGKQVRFRNYFHRIRVSRGLFAHGFDLAVASFSERLASYYLEIV